MYVTTAPVICNENIKHSSMNVRDVVVRSTDPHHAEKPQINVEESVGSEFNPLL